MQKDLEDFEQFMKQREDVARAYARGDAAPLGDIAAHVDPATFFGPKGGKRQGASEVAAKYRRDAGSFEPGGDSQFEILQMGASGGIGYWVGLQHATVRMRGSEQLVPIDLRVTEVFRREGDSWKLVHRHADTLTSEPQQQPQ